MSATVARPMGRPSAGAWSSERAMRQTVEDHDIHEEREEQLREEPERHGHHDEDDEERDVHREDSRTRFGARPEASSESPQ